MTSFSSAKPLAGMQSIPARFRSHAGFGTSTIPPWRVCPQIAPSAPISAQTSVSWITIVLQLEAKKSTESNFEVGRTLSNAARVFGLVGQAKVIECFFIAVFFGCCFKC